MLKNKVENVLRRNQIYRDSDKRLCVAVWSEFGLNLTEEQERKFMDCPSGETITRICRKFQEQGKYPASEKIEEARYEKFIDAKHSIAESITEMPQFEGTMEQLNQLTILGE